MRMGQMVGTFDKEENTETPFALGNGTLRALRKYTGGARCCWGRMRA